jgi:hypothetical protein
VTRTSYRVHCWLRLRRHKWDTLGLMFGWPAAAAVPVVWALEDQAVSLTPAAETLIHQLVMSCTCRACRWRRWRFTSTSPRVPQSVNPKLHAITRGAPRQGNPVQKTA